MEVKINREIRNYTEAMFFGLSIEQRWSLLFVRSPKCLHTSASPLSAFLLQFYQKWCPI